MLYENVHKKKELEKKGNLGLLYILKKLSDSKYAAEVASILNTILKEQGVEKAEKVYHKASKKNPNLPEPYFFVKEGAFVGYSVSVGEKMFIPAKLFFKNPDKYFQMHIELKKEESQKHIKFKEKTRIISDINYRMEKLNDYVNLENVPEFYLYLHKRNFGKVVEDNSYISAVQEVGKKFFVIKGYFEGKVNTLIKNAIETDEVYGFPMTFGYSYFGEKKAKRIFVVNDIYEIKRLAEIKKDSLDAFFSENKFIILNAVYCYNRIFSKEKEDKIYINALLKDPLTKEFLLGVSEVGNVLKIKGIVKNDEKYMENINKGTYYLSSELRKILDKQKEKKKSNLDFNTP